jgi:hypothetical protein
MCIISHELRYRGFHCRAVIDKFLRRFRRLNVVSVFAKPLPPLVAILARRFFFLILPGVDLFIHHECSVANSYLPRNSFPGAACKGRRSVGEEMIKLRHFYVVVAI